MSALVPYEIYDVTGEVYRVSVAANEVAALDIG